MVAPASRHRTSQAAVTSHRLELLGSSVLEGQEASLYHPETKNLAVVTCLALEVETRVLPIAVGVVVGEVESSYLRVGFVLL